MAAKKKRRPWVRPAAELVGTPRERRTTQPPAPQDIGRLCRMAFDLALQTAEDLERTGQLPDRKIARTRMLLAQGAADEVLKLTRKRTT